jgi:hypothetical protein
MLELFLREIFPKDEPFIKMFDFLKSLRETNISTSTITSPNVDDKNTKAIGKKSSHQKIRYVATDYETKIKQMSMIENLFEILENKQDGISKTYFLKSISKDNKNGRKDFDAIVSRAIMDGIIVGVGRKYYLRKNMMIQENNFHRKVYHVIYDNQPISSSSILTKIKYRNSKGRKKLLQILKLMSEEDLIEYSSNKWLIKE